MECALKSPGSSSTATLTQSPAAEPDQRLRTLERALRRRDAILAAVGFAAERFLGLSDWEASVGEVLDRLGCAAEVSRVDLFVLCRNDQGKVDASTRYEWAARYNGANGSGAGPSVGPVPKAGLARWHRLLSKGETIHGPVEAFPARERNALSAQRVRSLAVVPVRLGTECWGALRFIDCAAERDWSAVELEALRTAAGTLGAAIYRRRADEALRQSEERFRRLATATMEGIVIHDCGVILDANPSLARIFGYELAEVIGRNVLEFVPEAADRDLVLQHMRSDSEEPYEVGACRRDGSRIAVEVVGRSTPYDGRIVRVASVRDITERKQLEVRTQQLRREQAARAEAEAAERRAAFLAEASKVLATSFDYHATLSTLARLAIPEIADYCVVDVVEGEAGFVRVGVAHVNPAKEILLRQETRFITGVVSRLHPVVRVITEGKAVLVPDVDRLLIEASAISETHLSIIEAVAPRSLMSVPLTVSGRVVGALTLVASESGRRYGPSDLVLAKGLARQAAIAVDKARRFRQAEQAAQARDEVLAVVAHDLRNPLNTVHMGCTMLLEGTTTAEWPTERKQIRMMQRAGQRMNRLIHDLLDVRRMEQGRLSVNPRPESITAILKDALEMLHPLALAEGLTLEAEIRNNLPTVHGDGLRIQQVLSNLVGNAIKFTPRGGRITLRAWAEADEVRVAVVDTGPGISPEQLPHIFAQFWQGKRTDGRGLGLGLAIAKGIVDAHGGRIWVESRVGEGSGFYFTLRVAR